MIEKINPDIIRLKDILEAISDLEDFSQRDLSDKAVIKAICYSIAIIGEASGRLSQNLRQNNNHINWPAIIGMRNRIVHEYSGVSKTRVLEVIEYDIPELKQDILKIIKKF